MKINKELVKGSSDVLILSVLKHNDLYGYKITRDIQALSNDIFTLGEGTLYPVLHKLEKQKLLTSYWQEVGGRRRKYYSITIAGKKMLQEKKKEWKVFSSAVNAVIAI